MKIKVMIILIITGFLIILPLCYMNVFKEDDEALTQLNPFKYNIHQFNPEAGQEEAGKRDFSHIPNMFRYYKIELPETRVVEEAPIQEKKAEIQQKTDYKYMGSIEFLNGKVKYFFLDETLGETVELSKTEKTGDMIIREETETGFCIIIGETEYYVPK